TDPNFLDTSVIVLGTTTGGDVLNLITANGLCAALDVAGAPVVVEDDLGVDENELVSSLKIYPNPAIDNLNLTNSKGVLIESINFYDISGRIVKRIDVNNNDLYIRVNISELSSGIYLMILDSDRGQFKKKVIKK
ncbi:T9SS type A sorting domain-containing protein, partial [Oceanihabitans sp.]|nr:T9SS type A sorting domain-containing protein [Oceanihabitans sp.]